MKYLYITTLIFTTFMFSSCFKERIDLDLNTDENKRFAIEAWITDLDERQEVTLSLSSNYLDAFEPNFVNDARVTLSYDAETITFESKGNGVYAAPENWRAAPEKNYTIDVMYEDISYSATGFMRTMPPAQDFRSEFYETRDSIDYYNLFFGFQETPGEGDGYYGVDYLKGTTDGDPLTVGGFTNDDFGDGIYFSDVTVTDAGYEIGDTVILEVFSIGKDASDFLLDVITEVFREGVFDPPPVNVRSNFTNDALGYFIVSGAGRYEVVVEE